MKTEQKRGICVAVWTLLVAFGPVVCAQQPAPVVTQAAPVAPTWEKLKAAYDYDAKKPLDVKEETKKLEDAPDITAIHLTFAGTNGERVPGIFARPKGGEKVPVVILLHGLTSDKETMVKYFGLPLIKQGFAILALDAPKHGERRVAGETPGAGPGFLPIVHDGVLDWRRGLDYLETRKDIDKKRVGLLGYSMGSFMGSILGGVDSRVAASALCVGGDPLLPLAASLPDAIRPSLYAVCPSLYIGHIAPRPVFLLNGSSDTTVTADASTRLYVAAGQPKSQQMFDSGHILPPAATTVAVSWLTGKLKADAKQVGIGKSSGILTTGE